MDGTLLPMDIEVFTKAYFVELTKRMRSLGYDSELLYQAVWQGTGAMITNDGSCVNKEKFWEVFTNIIGERVVNDRRVFDEFYEKYFDNVRSSCGFDPTAEGCVRAAKDTGCKVVLASNPIFPVTAQLKRARWAGVDPELFDYVTSYENCRFCKPNPQYYLDIVNELGIETGECLMIGNDVDEDMCVTNLGMDAFLVTSWMLNRHGKDASKYRKGDLSDAAEYIKSIKR